MLNTARLPGVRCFVAVLLAGCAAATGPDDRLREFARNVELSADWTIEDRSSGPSLLRVDLAIRNAGRNRVEAVGPGCLVLPYFYADAARDGPPVWPDGLFQSGTVCEDAEYVIALEPGERQTRPIVVPVDDLLGETASRTFHLSVAFFDGRAITGEIPVAGEIRVER